MKYESCPLILVSSTEGRSISIVFPPYFISISSAFPEFFTFAPATILIMKSIAEKKKSQNIGEYLIYMYQMEDLIRSYQGNMEEINQYVISHYPVTDQEKKEIYQWLEEILKKMKAQEIMEKGHLQELNELVKNLSKLHFDLLKSDKHYFETYNQAKPFILEAVLAANGLNPGNEIQICLNGVYGLLLSRLLGKKVEERQLEAAEHFGNVLSILNFSYQQRIFMSPN